MLEIPIVTRIIDMKRNKEYDVDEETQEETRTGDFSLKAATDKKRLQERRKRLENCLSVNFTRVFLCFCDALLYCMPSFACISADRSLVPSKRAEYVPCTKMIQDANANANAKVGYHPGLPQRNKVYVLPKTCDQH